MFKKNKAAIALLFSILFAGSAAAQCKAPARESIKKLAPYAHNGEVNSVTLILGEPSPVHLSFYKGLNYKIQVSAEQQLGDISIRITDEDNNEVYNNKNDRSNAFEFYSNSSQELVVEISSTDKTKQGCAAIVVGIQSPKSNSIRNL